MDKNNKSYFLFPKAFFSSKYWKKKQVYSEIDAYLDLLSMATYSPYSRTLNKIEYHLEKGDILAGRNYLAKRWSWEETKVRRFIKSLIDYNLATKKTPKRTPKQTPKLQNAKTPKRNTSVCVINIDILDDKREENAQAESELFAQANAQANAHNNNKRYKEIKYIKEKKGESSPISIFNYLDDAFKDSTKFCDTWENWLAYRKEQNFRSWKAQTLKSQAEKIKAWGVDKTIESINNSIANGWQGLFEPRETKQNRQQQEFNRKRVYNGKF